MNTDSFRKQAHEVVDWIADYFEHIEEYPVKSPAKPGEIMEHLPDTPPEKAEPFDQIMKDFNEKIIPGITHWQHPRFMAYFPANNSGPSILGEMLMSALGAQCMSWQTSPAATELEERVMEWLRGMIGLPESFTGVIQDTASTATLCSLLMAREQVSNFRINEQGFSQNAEYAIYCSEEAHSSIEKAIKIAGFGRKALRKIPVDENFALIPSKLREAIITDLKNGVVPACVVAALGTTGSTAVDPLDEIGDICEEYDIWYHIDAAFSGTALLLPEKRWMSKGVEKADTFVFNPHKWMFTNFDCSAFYVKDPEALVRTFEILPEYLKTKEGSQVNNYRDWGIQLGRRFRALKLWFVIRQFGVEGLQQKIRKHIKMTEQLVKKIDQSIDFDRLAPVPVNTICFRYHPQDVKEEELNSLNKQLLHQLQDSGFVYLTHTKLNGQFAIRIVIGQTNVEERHVQEVWDFIQEKAGMPGGKVG